VHFGQAEGPRLCRAVKCKSLNATSPIAPATTNASPSPYRTLAAPRHPQSFPSTNPNIPSACTRHAPPKKANATMHAPRHLPSSTCTKQAASTPTPHQDHALVHHDSLTTFATSNMPIPSAHTTTSARLSRERVPGTPLPCLLLGYSITRHCNCRQEKHALRCLLRRLETNRLGLISWRQSKLKGLRLLAWPK